MPSIPSRGSSSIISKTQLTKPPSKEVEVKALELEADPNKNDRDSGHLYGFMILFVSNDGLNQFEHVTNYYMGEDDFQFFGDANLSYAPTEYFFSMPPQNIQMGDPFTTILTPTIGNSFCKESQGILLRPLSISGTTGFRPGIGIATTAALSQPDDMNSVGIPNSEKTGYFNFIQLRNLFRYYAFLSRDRNYIKQRTGSDKSVMLLWVNYHEGEFWECEPQAFNTIKGVNRPLSFDYAISCNCLRKFDAITFKPPDYMSWFRSITDVLNKINEYAYKVEQFVNKITNYGVVVASVARSSIDAFMTTSNAVLAAYHSADSLPDALANITDNLLDSAITAGKELFANWESYVAILGGPHGSPLDFGEDFYEAFYAGGMISASFSAFTKMKCLKKDAEIMTVSYKDFEYTSNTNSYPDMNTQSTTQALAAVGGFLISYVMSGDTIKDIALRTLGNQDRWTELVLINNLAPPYIANFPSKGVLTVGDPILIPMSEVDPRLYSNMVFPTNAGDFSTTTRDIDLAKSLYGTDLKVVFNGLAGNGTPVMDMAIVRGDLALVSGSDNFVQAMELKANTEKGSLKLHPWYGRTMLVGMKSDLAAITMTALNFKQCILADPRVLDIDDMLVRLQGGDILRIEMSIIGQRMLKRVPLITRVKR